jgi:hypothetical protein
VGDAAAVSVKTQKATRQAQKLQQSVSERFTAKEQLSCKTADSMANSTASTCMTETIRNQQHPCVQLPLLLQVKLAAAAVMRLCSPDVHGVHNVEQDCKRKTADAAALRRGVETEQKQYIAGWQHV